MADKNIVFREDGTVLLRNVRLSYEHIFEKYKGNEGDSERYSAVFILPTKTHSKAIKALDAHLKELAADEIDGKVKRDNFFLRNGEDSGKEEYEGAWTVNAAEKKRRPTALNRDKSPVTADDGVIYSGCWVNVLIRPWAQDNKFGKRINANLLMVQFVKDDEAFGGASVPDADDVFDDLEDGDFDDDDRSSKKSKAKTKNRSRDEDDDEDDEEEEDERPKGRSKSKPKSSGKKRPPDDEDDEEEDEEEDEPPRSKKSKAKAKPKASGKKRRQVDEDDEDEDDEY